MGWLIDKIRSWFCKHEWECTGLSTVGTTYRCKKCNATKLYPCDFNNGGITVTTV